MYPLRPIKVFFTNYYLWSNNLCDRFPSLSSNNHCAYPGLLAETFGIIAKNGPYQILPYVVRIGEGNQRTFNSELGGSNIFPDKEVLENKTFDTMAVPFQYTPEREKLVDFSYHTYKVRSFLYASRFDDPTIRWSLFQMYDLSLWQMIAFVMLLQCGFCIIVRHVEERAGRRHQETALQLLWKVIQVQLFQSKRIVFHFRAGNYSLLIFAYFHVVIFGIFSSYLLSAIIHPKRDYSFVKRDRIISDIKNGYRDIIAVTGSTWFEEKIAKGDEKPYDELKYALGGRKVRIVGHVTDALNEMRYKKAVLFFQEDEMIGFEMQAHCDFVRLKFKLPELESHLIFRKNFSELENISRIIEENIHDLYRLKDLYLARGNHENTKCDDFKIGDAMRITPYIGALLICSTLTIASLVALFLEVTINYCSTKLRPARTNLELTMTIG
ncbi:unnamed protein product [Bursaphelenchus xylophilus]|uniref:(pine wood nematode) hypothetical protein n=1 Tax=Bursaphelenchus xylophilus TaxID=6326 RepID=A0A7I8WMZ4_BURXY|nr:unnamed protein product [Bursaphelenchus xylophilus]CAG9092515.1 unnamed protein product [Bursaphelenchus xylophilus]